MLLSREVRDGEICGCGALSMLPAAGLLVGWRVAWSILLGAEVDPGLGWDWYGAGSLPYLFTVQDGVVTHVVEQYLP